MMMGAPGYRVITVTAGENPGTGKLNIWDGLSDMEIDVRVTNRIDLRNPDTMRLYNENGLELEAGEIVELLLYEGGRWDWQIDEDLMSGVCEIIVESELAPGSWRRRPAIAPKRKLITLIAGE